MRPLALALLLLPAAVRAQPADGEALIGAFVEGRAPADGRSSPAAAAVEKVQAEWKADPRSPGLSKDVEAAYGLLVPKKDRPEVLERARAAYGLVGAGKAASPDEKKELAELQAKMSRLPPGDKARDQIAARIGRLSAALGRPQAVDGAGAGSGAPGGKAGVAVAGRDDAARKAALDRFKSAPAGPGIKLDGQAPPPLDAAPQGGVTFDGVALNPKQQARVGAEVSNIRDVLDADNLNGYMDAADRRQITDAWGRAVARNVAPDGHIPNMKKTVNDFRDILLDGREAHDGTTRVAEHWGEMAVGTYSVGAWASIPASLAWNTFSVTKGQLLRSWRYVRGEGPPPPAGNYWGEQMNKSLVTESAAAGWASSLEGADHQKAVDGVVETLKLDEFAAFVKQNGVLGTAGAMKDRYSQ